MLASPCLVRVTRGIAYIPVVNVGKTDVLLYPRTGLGTLSSAQVVNLPADVTAVKPTMASVSSQVAAGVWQGGVDAVDLSALAEQEKMEVHALLQKYHAVFSNHDGDLGSHGIPLLDDAPVKQRYRGIPLSGHEEVKSHQLLDV